MRELDLCIIGISNLRKTSWDVALEETDGQILFRPSLELATSFGIPHQANIGPICALLLEIRDVYLTHEAWSKAASILHISYTVALKMELATIRRFCVDRETSFVRIKILDSLIIDDKS
ncbi:MAG: hypothetical protein COV07_01065 [Candidatus Vogelbacteria bacterium CG10_big_fil_rev_8_21_14_0_10_45_14]|uniref:Uncharacterized protein n=1 Tax=Candidatus Vogelbacteria bacterium CG10_big_fil_rev_8_21_14_0_10_45_14 TaxID=1975042 RepID=A0A2H0RKS0_9BACT|nr:MAG: hypothetical protein COV07_01065 [Candidatus Vogelbacteria bacterium CG10_big_fil_rev_8_21_14_0_10_45_14]